MRVCVVGLGGVGGYIAAYFAKSGIDVVGVARGKHLSAIEKNGLQIKEDGKTFRVEFPVCNIQELEGKFDAVLFCTKSYDLEEAAKRMCSHITKESVLVSFGNGVNNADVLRGVCDAKVAKGCVYILSHIETPGVVKKQGDVFAAVFGGEGNEDLVKLFEKSNLRYKLSLDIQKDLWKKYIFIAAFATLTSYYDLPIRKVYETHREQTETVLKEIAHLAWKKGIDINKEVEKSLKTASVLPPKASTSMRKDFQNKNKTELESLTGYLVKEAREIGVELPCISKMYEELAHR